MRRKYFWDPANISGDNQEPTAGSFEYSDAERFCEGGVQKDVAAAQNIPDLGVLQTTQELNTVMEAVLVQKLDQQVHFIAVTTDNKSHIFIKFQYFGNNADQQINTLTVL